MIYYFDPGHETAVLNASPYYMAPANVVAMQNELSCLPVWYAGKNDLVLVANEESKVYINALSENFAGLPGAITEADLTRIGDTKIVLWGISPQAIRFFDEIATRYNLVLCLPSWHDELIYLNSRQSAHDCLEKLVKDIPRISECLIPRIYTSLDRIEEAVSESGKRFLAKAPFSSSGRGLLWLPVGGLTRTERQILHGILKKQGSVMIEQVVDKRTDFAMEFVSDGHGAVRFGGYSLFRTNEKGAYMGNYLGSQADIEAQLAGKIGLPLLEEVKSQLSVILSAVYTPYYEGCIGVDMMLYEEDGNMKIHPCVEINMRYNMGYLSLNFSENYIHEGSAGYYNLDFNVKAGETYRLHREMAEKYPLEFENGKIRSGYLSLCPVDEGTHYRAYVLIGNNEVIGSFF